MPEYGQSFTFRDDKGQTAVVRMFLTAADAAAANTAGSDIASTIAPLSNAALQGSSGAYTSTPAANTYGANAEYERVEDKAVLTFQTAVGSIHRYKVPAPKVAIFLADGETVDPANALVIAFVADMLAAGASRDGVALSSFIGGTRDATRLKRKFNIFTRNPALTGPGL